MFYRPHKRVTHPGGGELMTKQEFAGECDIHNILKQYKRTGMIAHIAAGKARFEELPSELDFQMGLHAVMQAEAAFAELPAKVRAQFDNSPARLLAAIEDPAQRATLEELGIFRPRPAAAADPSSAPPPPAGA